MGALFGGLLAQAGHEVELLEINEAQIAAIRDKGLQIDTDQGSRTVAVRISRPEESRIVPDWMLVFTKTLHTTPAMASARHLIGEHTAILSLQNGLGNAEKLRLLRSRAGGRGHDHRARRSGRAPAMCAPTARAAYAC